MQGLKVGDHILKFGSITSDNFNDLQDIASVVQHSRGVSINKTVLLSSSEPFTSLETQEQLVGSKGFSWAKVYFDPTNCPWVSEDEPFIVLYLLFFSQTPVSVTIERQERTQIFSLTPNT